ncbi:hypothetical protein BDP67DRAFT_128570 [Colletotrichum lupini]|nr:hypothetical protein BDP67DRAFT_128570 [Colletotrichum lupini]
MGKSKDICLPAAGICAHFTSFCSSFLYSTGLNSWSDVFLLKHWIVEEAHLLLPVLALVQLRFLHHCNSLTSHLHPETHSHSHSHTAQPIQPPRLIFPISFPLPSRSNQLHHQHQRIHHQIINAHHLVLQRHSLDLSPTAILAPIGLLLGYASAPCVQPSRLAHHIPPHPTLLLQGSAVSHILSLALLPIGEEFNLGIAAF